VNDHQRAFAFVEIPEDLLSITLRSAFEVEEIVSNLERRSQMKAKAGQRAEVGLTPGSDQSSNPEWEDGRIRAGLEQHHVEVVIGG
jgi:hypothetical protein